MADFDKASERSTLILQFGRVLAPLMALAERKLQPTAAEYRVAAAIFRPDVDRWANEVSRVTTRGKQDYGVSNVLAVSRLAALEFANYKLLECNPKDLHDRNLRIDDTIFFLGPSIAEAGKPPTNFAPADGTAAGHAVLDGVIARSRHIT